MSKKADKIVEWESSDGSQRCILIVTNEEKSPQSVDYRTIEMCKFNSDEDKWETEEEIDAISEIDSFGIPEGFAS